MSKFKVKKLPPIKLVDLLKKRKTNLKQFLFSSGVTTYVTLESKCNSMGVSPPSREEFREAAGEIVSSPQEGVVVLDPPVLLKDTGEKIQVDEIKFKTETIEAQKEPEPVVADSSPIVSPVKSSKKKKEVVTEES